MLLAQGRPRHGNDMLEVDSQEGLRRLPVREILAGNRHCPALLAPERHEGCSLQLAILTVLKLPMGGDTD